MGTPSSIPTALVIFGGTGDLATTKLLPALWSLYQQGKLTTKLSIIGLSRKPWDDDDYRDFVRSTIRDRALTNLDENALRVFSEHFHFVSGNFNHKGTYDHIKEDLLEFDRTTENEKSNKLFYLAVPPEHYASIFLRLHESKVLTPPDRDRPWSRLLVEKPFGHDLDTARALEKELCGFFAEEQIYRIDHYLAKDAIENIIALRFENAIFSDSWHGEAIESIHIKLLETKDVSNRGAFYDETGALRDVGQNHLLQIFSLLTMPAIETYEANAIRNSRAEALRSLLDHQMNAVVRGQYTGYRSTIGVDQESDTETYFRLSFSLLNEPWKGTEFILEAGKALNESVNEAVITFRGRNLCHCEAEREPHYHKNILKIQFSPKQYMSVKLWTKKPGFNFILREEELVLTRSSEATSYSPEAYEHVLFDCLRGDQTRFVSSEEVDLAWRFITPILDEFRSLPLLTYASGSTGPDTQINN